MKTPEALPAVIVGMALMGVVYLLLVLGRRLLRVLPVAQVALPTEPVPSTWPAIVERLVPLSHRLSAAERERLLRLTQNFVRDVPMEGCGGLELTDEMRVTIAASACLLLLGLPYPRFTALRRVLLYPDTFVPVQLMSRTNRIETESEPTLGQAWRDGIVVLAWTSVHAGGANIGDGHNVVLHEFAHVLDGEDGVFDGMPILDSPEAIREWGRVFAAEFARQQDGVNHAHNVELDPYAATNRAEFFAVATEAFFETGPTLKTLLPDLYAQLKQFYRQDPAAWR